MASDEYLDGLEDGIGVGFVLGRAVGRREGYVTGYAHATLGIAPPRAVLADLHKEYFALKQQFQRDSVMRDVAKMNARNTERMLAVLEGKDEEG